MSGDTKEEGLAAKLGRLSEASRSRFVSTPKIDADQLVGLKSRISRSKQPTLDKRSKEDAEIDDLDQWVELRTRYAEKLYILLVGEIIFLCVLILGVGIKLLEFNEWVLGVFVTGVLTHTFSLVHTIVKNLFKKN